MKFATLKEGDGQLRMGFMRLGDPAHAKASYLDGGSLFGITDPPVVQRDSSCA